MQQHARRRAPRHAPPALVPDHDVTMHEAIVTLLYAAADMLGSGDAEERRRAGILLAAIRIAEEACGLAAAPAMPASPGPARPTRAARGAAGLA